MVCCTPTIAVRDRARLKTCIERAKDPVGRVCGRELILPTALRAGDFPFENAPAFSSLFFPYSFNCTSYSATGSRRQLRRTNAVVLFVQDLRKILQIKTGCRFGFTTAGGGIPYSSDSADSLSVRISPIFSMGIF